LAVTERIWVVPLSSVCFRSCLRPLSLRCTGSDMDMTRRGKFNTKLWVKDVRPTDSGTAFYWHQFRVPQLKHSNAPHGWCVHKPQPNLLTSVGPIPVQSMAPLEKSTLCPRRRCAPIFRLHAITRPTIIIGIVVCGI
jgi:hypothetical protein